MGGLYSVSNSTPNTWAYQMFPNGTPYSITNPQDSIGNLNDVQLTNFDFTVDSLERNSVAMMNNFEQMYKMYQAQIAEWSKNTYPNLSSNTNITIPGMPGMTPGVTPGRYSSLIVDTQVADYISRLENDSLYGPELKKKVTLDDKKQVTYLKRLNDLIKDYLTAETPLLSADDFAKIKEIAGKIAKTGKITKADFLTLKKIVENNKGKLGSEIAAENKKKAAEEAKKTEEEQKKTEEQQREENAKAPVEKPYGYQQTAKTIANVEYAAEQYHSAMYSAGTSIDTMNKGYNETTKYNVIEIIDKFQDISATQNGHSLIEYIMDDFDNYGTGRSHWWLTDDDAKPYVDKLATSMYERVGDLKELKNANGEQKLSAATINKLNNAVAALKNDMAQKVKEGKNGADMSDTAKQNLVNKFTALVNAIKAAEIEAYGRGHQDKVYVPAAQA